MPSQEFPTQAQNDQNELNRLIDEAMKQPGIKDVMHAMEVSEAYSKSAEEVALYVGWQRYPEFYSSAHTACPE